MNENNKHTMYSALSSNQIEVIKRINASQLYNVHNIMDTFRYTV